MKHVAVIADSHFCEDSRFDECVRIHAWIADDIARRGVDLIVHTGDVFDRKSTPTERLAVAGWLGRLADVAPVVVVRGNHDCLGELPLFQALRAASPIEVIETVGVHILNGIAIAGIAWPRKAHLLANLDAGHAAGEQAASDALRDVLRGISVEWDDFAGPRLLAMHAMVRGSKTSTGQPLVGCDLEIGVEDLALAQADFVALGHIHAGQDWTVGDAPVVYPGSPRRTAFGETEEKGYLLVSLDDDGAARWERIATPTTAMILAEDEWRDGAWLVGWHGLDPEHVAGAEVRLRYDVPSDQRDAAKRAAHEVRDDLIKRGAANVKVEERVVATTRARAPEIAAAKTLEEKLQALWRARGTEPDEARAERLVGKVREIEAA